VSDFYKAEIEHLLKELVKTQEIAIERGWKLIEAQIEIANLKKEIWEAKQAR